jgi:hypothetical protein
VLVVAFVAVPLAVVERPHPLSAFRRAADLTRGERVFVLGALVVAWAACTTARVWLLRLPWTNGTWIRAAIRAVLAVPPAVALVVSYHELRAERPFDEEVAEVFE